LGTFAQVALRHADKPVAEYGHGVPLGAFLALARVLILPRFGRGDAKVRYPPAVLERLDFRVLAKVPNEDDLVDAACHYAFSFSLARSLIHALAFSNWDAGTSRRSRH